jgi:hypothetical protein
LLERTTHVALITVSCISAWVLIRNQLLPPKASWETIVSPLQGETITLGGVNWEQVPQTVVVVLSAHCHWCKASVPLYQRVSKLHKAAMPAFQLIAVSAGTVDELTKFLIANSIEVDRVIPAEAARLGNQATPTVLLVDHRGKVVSSWQGAKRSSDESAFLEILRKSP